MPTPSALREHVLNVLTARQAHCTFEEAVADMPTERVGARPEDLPYSVWELVEHIRRAQHDILVYCRNPDYEAPDWPDAYWPDASTPPNPDAWTNACAQVAADRDALCEYARDETHDLYDTVPSHDDHTYLRELLLVADHNAYHIGQIVTVRRQLGLWDSPSDST